jgi:hypothetical protein
MILEKWNAIVLEANGFEESITVPKGAVGSNIEMKFFFFSEYSVPTNLHLKAL